MYSDEDEEEVFAVGREVIVCPDCGRPSHGDTACDVNINYVLAQKKMDAKHQVAKAILANNQHYIRHPTGPRQPSSKGAPSRRQGERGGNQTGGRKKFGKVTQVAVEEEDSVSVADDDSPMDDGVNLLRLDYDSDVEDQFVLSVATCFLEDCPDSDLHLNY